MSGTDLSFFTTQFLKPECLLL